MIAYSPQSTILSGTISDSKLSVEEKVALALQVAENGGECVKVEELHDLFSKKPHPICYDGFEPSGRIHIAQGIMKAINVNRLTKCGCVFVFWVADVFALLNNKMGGDLEKIKLVGKYFVEVWKAVGMDLTNVRFLWALDEINKNPTDYWLRVMNIARASSIARVKRCCQIMGRGEGDDNPSAQIMYPCMQCADIFYLGADICQLGLDQRKVNMLAREYLDKPECAETKSRKQRKPVILSHGMLPGLIEGQEKMSKSNPDSAIFMEDSVADVNRKIKKAFCPPGVADGNPCVAYVSMIVLPHCGSFLISRSAEHGGDLSYTKTDEFKADYVAGKIHPKDLKTALAKSLNDMIEPVRKHFEENEEAKKLLATIRSFKSDPVKPEQPKSDQPRTSAPVVDE